MIKIEPFLAVDATQMRALLRHQDEPLAYESFCAEEKLFNSGWLFWQHWLPCRYQLAPAVYVAKENGVMLGLISLVTNGKAGSCWRIDHVVVHPQHRGRGIAQKLLQYVFALFGSQGVSHFITEISCQNSPAMSLLAACGFRRAARLVHYQMPSDWHFAAEEMNPDKCNGFRWAKPTDQSSLFQLAQDALPSDLRFVYAREPEDFTIKEVPPDVWQWNINRLTKLESWYWVKEDEQRQALQAAIKVTAHRQGDFHIEFIIHPGWQNMSTDAFEYAMVSIARLNMKGILVAKAYDYEPSLTDLFAKANWQRTGEFLLLVKEHWLKVKKTRALKFENTVTLPTIAKPAINLPYRPT